MFTLRPYQREALSALVAAAPQRQFLLLQAATGAGKTVVFCALARYYFSRWGMRTLVLAHRSILVRQAMDKLLQEWPAGEDVQNCGKDVGKAGGRRPSLGLVCASVSSRREADADVVVASPQTLKNHLEELPKVDIVVIDECHRVGPKNLDSTYKAILEAVLARRPGARVIGVTATPWRLGQGCIYGSRAVAGTENWWDRIDCRISMAELQRQGYLVPLRALSCPSLRVELAGLDLSSGDYNETQLAKLMSRPLELDSAVKAFLEHAGGRRRCVAFCCTITHAAMLAARFRQAGIEAGVVDSSRESADNQSRLDDFKRGRIRVLCNVGMLTEGWDCPEVDCLLLCRPTMSPALYVQMVGRGLRPAAGKRDCLLLDLVDNVGRHGSPNAPRIVPGARAGEAGLPGQGPGERPGRSVCQWCGALLPEGARPKACPECQGPLVAVNNRRLDLLEVDFEHVERWQARGDEVARARRERARQMAEQLREAREQASRAREESMARRLAGGKTFEARLVRMSAPAASTSSQGRLAGLALVRCQLLFESSACPGRPIPVTLLLDPEGAGARRSGAKWLSLLTRRFWDAFGGRRPLPRTCQDMLSRWGELTPPASLPLREGTKGFVNIQWPAEAKPGKAGKSPKPAKNKS
jgi:DNA repair protein RadD